MLNFLVKYILFLNKNKNGVIALEIIGKIILFDVYQSRQQRRLLNINLKLQKSLKILKIKMQSPVRSFGYKK